MNLKKKTKIINKKKVKENKEKETRVYKRRKVKLHKLIVLFNLNFTQYFFYVSYFILFFFLLNFLYTITVVF